MADFNAHVTVDSSGDLTRHSVVTVNFGDDLTAMEVPVPTRGMFWERINAALATIGWVADRDAGFHARYDTQGRLCFRADEEHAD